MASAGVDELAGLAKLDYVDLVFGTQARPVFTRVLRVTNTSDSPLLFSVSTEPAGDVAPLAHFASAFTLRRTVDGPIPAKTGCDIIVHMHCVLPPGLARGGAMPLRPVRLVRLADGNLSMTTAAAPAWPSSSGSSATSAALAAEGAGRPGVRGMSTDEGRAGATGLGGGSREDELASTSPLELLRVDVRSTVDRRSLGSLLCRLHHPDPAPVEVRTTSTEPLTLAYSPHNLTRVIEIENHTSRTLAFQVMSTMHRLFRVSVDRGTVAAGQVATVSVTLAWAPDGSALKPGTPLPHQLDDDLRIAFFQVEVVTTSDTGREGVGVDGRPTGAAVCPADVTVARETIAARRLRTVTADRSGAVDEGSEDDDSHGVRGAGGADLSRLVQRREAGRSVDGRRSVDRGDARGTRTNSAGSAGREGAAGGVDGAGRDAAFRNPIPRTPTIVLGLVLLLWILRSAHSAVRNAAARQLQQHTFVDGLGPDPGLPPVGGGRGVGGSAAGAGPGGSSPEAVAVTYGLILWMVGIATVMLGDRLLYGV